jgi:uncharacterized membrane protein YeiB
MRGIAMIALFSVTMTELVIVAVIAALLVTPVVLALLALLAFNQYQTQRRSDIVDQALTRDADIAPLPPADEPAGRPRV